MSKRFSKSSAMILAASVITAAIHFSSPPPLLGENTAAIIRALEAFQANPTKLNALQVLRYSSGDRPAAEVRTDSPRAYDGTLWEVDDIKVDILHEKLAEIGKTGSQFPYVHLRLGFGPAADPHPAPGSPIPDCPRRN